MERAPQTGDQPELLRLFLFRHGETEWSRLGRHTSHSEIPLSSKGERDAHALGSKISGLVFQQVLTSPRLRARRTCELAGLDRHAEIESLLQEWNYGDFEGLTTVEIVEKSPAWNLFKHGAPKGETPGQIASRADELLKKLRQNGGNVALFSHGHLLRSLAVRWAGWPIQEAQRLYLGTASISILAYEHRNPQEPVIELWNSRDGLFSR